MLSKFLTSIVVLTLPFIYSSSLANESSVPKYNDCSVGDEIKVSKSGSDATGWYEYESGDNYAQVGSTFYLSSVNGCRPNIKSVFIFGNPKVIFSSGELEFSPANDEAIIKVTKKENSHDVIYKKFPSFNLKDHLVYESYLSNNNHNKYNNICLDRNNSLVSLDSKCRNNHEGIFFRDDGVSGISVGPGGHGLYYDLVTWRPDGINKVVINILHIYTGDHFQIND